MKRKHLYCFGIIAILLTSNNAFSQSFNSLPLLKVVNEQMISVLDSVVEFEKKCDYYSDKLFFDIYINELNDSSKSLIVIESQLDSNLVQSLIPLGYFLFKKHYFFCYKSIPKEIFIKDNGFKKFYYQEPDPNIDDSFTQTHYNFKNGHLYYENRYSYCK